MWKLTMFALGLLCAGVLLCPCVAENADTDMEEPAKELSVRSDPKELIEFPGADAIMEDFNTFTTKFKEFQTSLFSSTIDKIIDFLKMLIELLEALKEKLKEAIEFLEHFRPFTDKLISILENICDWIDKLLRLLKALLKVFEALDNFFDKLKELLGEADESSKALGDRSGADDVPSLGELFKMLSEFLEELRRAIFCRCPWPEKLEHFKHLIEKLKKLIEFKERIMKKLKPGSFLYQLLERLDKYLDMILKYLQNAIAQERYIRRSNSRAAKTAKMVKWCRIPGIFCICDHHVNPQMFWCPMPQYKGCYCRAPNPRCI